MPGVAIGPGLARSVRRVVEPWWVTDTYGGLAPRVLFAADDMLGRYYARGQGEVAEGLCFSNARSGTRWYKDASGVYVSAAGGSTLRIPDVGAPLLQSITNSIRNSSMVGAVAGTPGTMPSSGWVAGGGTGAGTVTREVIGTGTEYGLPYLDLRVYGTFGASGNFYYNITIDSGIAAANGDSWLECSYVRLIGGSLTNVSNIRLLAAMSSAVPAYLTEAFPAAPSFISGWDGTFKRVVNGPATLSNASVASISPYMQINASANSSIDLTLRIYAPQLVKTSVDIDSPVLTTNASATVGADIRQMIGPALAAFGGVGTKTLIAQYKGPSYATNAAATRQYLLYSRDDGLGDRWAIRAADTTNNTPNVVLSEGGADYNVNLAAASLAANTDTRLAFRWSNSEQFAALSVNGADAVTVARTSARDLLNGLYYGSGSGGNTANIIAQRLAVIDGGHDVKALAA